eukprot:10650116-Alexandrium_andersonii.AAC.1
MDSVQGGRLVFAQGVSATGKWTALRRAPHGYDFANSLVCVRNRCLAGWCGEVALDPCAARPPPRGTRSACGRGCRGASP